MKKITLLLSLLAMSLGFSQIAPIDFEPGGNGADWTWATFEPPTGETVDFTVSDNPSTTGINSSAKVGKIDISFATTENWGSAGVESNHGADIGTFTITASNSYVTMQVYQEGFTAPVALKLANATGAALVEVTSLLPVTTAGVWQEVSFDLSAWIGNVNNPVDQIIFFPSYAPRASGHVVYFDNVTFGTEPIGDCSDGIQNGDETGIDCGGRCGTVCTVPAPLVSAPISTTPESDVIWIYSDVFTNTANQVSFNDADWANGASNIGSSTEEMIAGTSDNIRYITDINVLFANLPFTDVSTFNYFHVDIWSTNSSFAIVKWESGNSPESGQIGVVLTPNEWTGVDIDLNTFDGLANPNARMNLGNFIIDAAGGHDYYFDNVYFSKSAFSLSSKSSEIEGLKVYPNPSQDSWTITTKNIQINSIQVFDILGKNVISLKPETTKATIDASGLKSGLYFAKISTASGTSSLKLVKQ
jgi:hypothetical protein